MLWAMPGKLENIIGRKLNVSTILYKNRDMCFPSFTSNVK